MLEKRNALEVKRNAKLAASKQSSWFATATENTQEENEEMKILELMEKRLEATRRELAMLFFSLHGAQSFFKDTPSK